MAEAHGGGLSHTFGKAAKHLFSFTMIFMMASVALPAIAAAAAPGAATLGDLGMGLVDHYWTMVSAPFTEFSTVSDIASNTFAGNLAPSSYTALGTGAAHAGHGAAAAAGAAGHAGAASAASHAAMGHGVCAPFDVWQGGLSAGDLATMKGDAAALGIGLQDYYQSNFCMS